MPLTIAEMQEQSWRNSEEKGFHATPEDRSVPVKLMLIVSELAEALEEYRANKPVSYYSSTWNRDTAKPEGIAAELADAMIRIGDLAEIIGFDLEAAVVEKMAFNKTRSFKHGGKRI